jgi:hypothetical protein
MCEAHLEIDERQQPPGGKGPQTHARVPGLFAETVLELAA